MQDNTLLWVLLVILSFMMIWTNSVVDRMARKLTELEKLLLNQQYGKAAQDAAPTPERLAQLTSENRVRSAIYDNKPLGREPANAAERMQQEHLQYLARANRETGAGSIADRMLGIDLRDSIAMDIAMQLPISPSDYSLPIEGLPDSIPYDDPLIGTILQVIREGVADECYPLYLDAKGLARCKLHGNRANCPRPLDNIVDLS